MGKYEAEAEDSRPPRVLIVDQDGDLADAIVTGFKKDGPGLGKRGVVPVFVETVRSSQVKLSDRDFSYAAVFVNPVIGAAAWIAVVKSTHQYRAGIPIFVIYDDRLKVGKSEAGSLGLAGAIPKPFDYMQMIGFIFGEAAESAIVEEDANPTAEAGAPAPVSSVDTDYAEVDLTGVLGRLKSKFDVYVRLSNGKYVRILNSGDTLSADRVESYKAKGVSTLYILRSAQDDYLKFLDTMVAELVKDTSVSIEVKATHVGSQAKSTAEYLKNSGFSEASLAQAQQYVNNSVEMVNQIAGKSEVMKKLLNDVAAYEHSLACSTLAGLLLKYIGGGNAAILNAMGVACFVHDIALLGQPAAIMDEDEEKMTAEQRVIYHAHPEEGAKLVKKMKGVPPIVATAVAQHHLRMNKGGFPKEKAVAEVNRMSELIGLCHEFLKLLKLKERDATLDPFLILRERAAREFSAPIVDAFVRTFQEK